MWRPTTCSTAPPSSSSEKLSQLERRRRTRSSRGFLLALETCWLALNQKNWARSNATQRWLAPHNLASRRASFSKALLPRDRCNSSPVSCWRYKEFSRRWKRLAKNFQMIPCFCSHLLWSEKWRNATNNETLKMFLLPRLVKPTG